MMSRADATTGHDDRDLTHDTKPWTRPRTSASTMLNIDDPELYQSSSDGRASALSRTTSLTKHRPSLLLAAVLRHPWPGTPRPSLLRRVFARWRAEPILAKLHDVAHLLLFGKPSSCSASASSTPTCPAAELDAE
jgi:hypothetical protein